MEQVFETTGIDPWFLTEVQDLILQENEMSSRELTSLSYDEMWQLKRCGFSDGRFPEVSSVAEDAVRAHRHSLENRPV